MLDWKKAKKFINQEFFEKLISYNPVGPKEGEYQKYQKINFLIKNIDEVKIDEVENY